MKYAMPCESTCQYNRSRECVASVGGTYPDGIKIRRRSRSFDGLDLDVLYLLNGHFLDLVCHFGRVRRFCAGLSGIERCLKYFVKVRSKQGRLSALQGNAVIVCPILISDHIIVKCGGRLEKSGHEVEDVIFKV